MADQNQTIEWAWTADISDLETQLKRIPGMSKEEAAKMAKNIEKGFKDTEKAAKSAASANTKSMGKMQASAKKTGNSMKQMKRGAAEMGRGLAELTVLFGDSDSAMGQFMQQASVMALSLGAIAPLAGAARAGLIGLGVSAAAATGGLTVLAAGAAFLVNKMMASNTETAKQKKEIKKLATEHKKLGEKLKQSIKKNDQFTKSIEKSKSAIDRLIKDIEEETLEFEFEEGRLSLANYLAELEKIEKSKAAATVMAQFDETEKSLAANTAHLEAQYDMAARSLAAWDDIVDTTKHLNTEQVAQRKLQIETLGGMEQYFVASQAAMDTQLLFHKAAKEESEFIKTRATEQGRILGLRNDLIEKKSIERDLDMTAADAAEKKADAADRQATRAEEAARQAELLKEIEDMTAESQAAAADLAEEALATRISTTTEAAALGDLMRQQMQAEIDGIKAQQRELSKRAAAALAVAETDAQIAAALGLGLAVTEEQAALDDKIARLKEKHAKDLEAMEARAASTKAGRFDVEKLALEELYALEAELRNSSIEGEQKKHAIIVAQIKEREMKTLEGTKKLMGNFESYMGARIEALQNSGRDEQEAIAKLHYMQQGAAAGQVAIQTAENVVSAMKYGPVLGPVLAGSYVALAAAQTAAIMSQPPPQTRHMGGMIPGGSAMAPDESQYRLLSGEAVLSRQAVRNMGGQEGIQRMERGSQKPEVIILQPYKHFDRYLNQRNKRKARRASNGGY